jgi:hypothetical protein
MNKSQPESYPPATCQPLSGLRGHHSGAEKLPGLRFRCPIERCKGLEQTSISGNRRSQESGHRWRAPKALSTGHKLHAQHLDGASGWKSE